AVQSPDYTQIVWVVRLTATLSIRRHNMDNMYKARALAEDLKSELELRALGDVVLSFGADGDALLQVTGDSTDAALIQVTTVVTTARDALGLQHGAFTPHIIRIATRDGA